MENIVYILGAGFSTYAGLPLMSNFYIKSKDMYFDNPGEYQYFQRLYNNIDQMAKIKNYYQANLFNIEEILSILEMQQKIGGKGRLRKDFIRYIVDVIEYYSPKKNDFKNFERYSNDWYHEIFGNEKIMNEYGNLILALLKAKLSNFHKDQYKDILFEQENLPIEYSIITLNYDRLIENYLDFIDQELIHDKFTRIPIYKLHGCISKGNIIPPTWAKSISKELIQTWKDAFKKLEEATKIRIIGYSLPITDSYLRYYLKSAVIHNERLKEIDIICYDPSGNVKKSFDDFIIFEKKRFQNKKVEDYLQNTCTTNQSVPYRTDENKKLVYTYSYYERNHDNFMHS